MEHGGPPWRGWCASTSPTPQTPGPSNLSFRRLQDGAETPGPRRGGGRRDGAAPPLPPPPLRNEGGGLRRGALRAGGWAESVGAGCPPNGTWWMCTSPRRDGGSSATDVMGINHRQGVFRSEVTPMGGGGGGGSFGGRPPPPQDHGQDFQRLRVHQDRGGRDGPLPRAPTSTDRWTTSWSWPWRRWTCPEVVGQAMLYDWVLLQPGGVVRTMPMMTWVVAAHQGGAGSSGNSPRRRGETRRSRVALPRWGMW